MRDPDRIERIGRKLLQVWRLHPDWRLGQLLSNVSGPGIQDVFHPEDDLWETWLEEELKMEHEGRSIWVGPNEMKSFVHEAKVGAKKMVKEGEKK